MSLTGDLLCRVCDTEQSVIFFTLLMALPLLSSTSVSDKQRGKKKDQMRKENYLLLHEVGKKYQVLNKRKAVK